MSGPAKVEKSPGQVAYEGAMAYFHWLPQSAGGALSFDTGRRWEELSEVEQGLWIRAGSAVAQQVTGALL